MCVCVCVNFYVKIVLIRKKYEKLYVGTWEGCFGNFQVSLLLGSLNSVKGRSECVHEGTGI